MYQGNWKCSSCGGEITELPFQPRSENGLTCRACYAKGKSPQSSTPSVPEMATADEAPPIPDEAGLASAPPEDDGFGTDATPVTPGESPKFEGDWKCSACGTPITSLPFKPYNTENLLCIDCFKKSKS